MRMSTKCPMTFQAFLVAERPMCFLKGSFSDDLPRTPLVTRVARVIRPRELHVAIRTETSCERQRKTERDRERRSWFRTN